MGKIQQDISLKNNNNQLQPASDKTEVASISKCHDIIEMEEEFRDYRLIIHQVDASKHNKLNPCSKLPSQIRREQFISLCADIWRRHIDEATKERETNKDENLDNNA